VRCIFDTHDVALYYIILYYIIFQVSYDQFDIRLIHHLSVSVKGNVTVVSGIPALYYVKLFLARSTMQHKIVSSFFCYPFVSVRHVHPSSHFSSLLRCIEYCIEYG
jgi:hypothetical protein